MIQFTDPRLYVKGICNAQLADASTGDILFSSNKFSTGNIAFSASNDPLRAGLGNPIATIVTSDADITINFTQADFNMVAKMAAVGGSVSYNAVAPICTTVTANSSSLTVDVSDATPVAPYNYTSPICYVQTVGESSLTATNGTAYAINPSSGAISGFAATNGKTYKVWYFTQKASAMVGTVNSALDGIVGNFSAQIAVYSNVGNSSNTGTRVGWLYVYALVKLLPEGANLTGDQGNYDTTVISGRVVSPDDYVVSSTCTDCGTADLMYYVYVPDDGADDIIGLAVIGGAVSVVKSKTVQIQPYFVMANNQLVAVSPTSLCTYTVSTALTGLSVNSSGKITAGTTTGDAEVLVSYNNDGTTLTCPVNVTVTAS